MVAFIFFVLYLSCLIFPFIWPDNDQVFVHLWWAETSHWARCGFILFIIFCMVKFHVTPQFWNTCSVCPVLLSVFGDYYQTHVGASHSVLHVCWSFWGDCILYNILQYIFLLTSFRIVSHPHLESFSSSMTLLTSSILCSSVQILFVRVSLSITMILFS